MIYDYDNIIILSDKEKQTYNINSFIKIYWESDSEYYVGKIKNVFKKYIDNKKIIILHLIEYDSGEILHNLSELKYKVI
jgi:hypothetical protein